MKPTKYLKASLLGGAAALLGMLSISPSARANIYATDIKVGGVLSNGPVASPQNGYVPISYILNEPATGGVTITISSNGTLIDTITIATGSAGTLRGLNTVAWGTTNSLGSSVPEGTYSFSITASATGYTTWTQTSVDTNAGQPANYALGIDVDKNTNSLYYGRVVIGNAIVGANASIPAAAKMVGFYKMNADGSQADEGWYGNANYLSDDGGDTQTAGQMPNSGGYDPMKIRIGDDDRIYWIDNSGVGAVIACDILATTNQVVIDDGGSKGGLLGGPYNYAGNPDIGDLVAGFQVFDVAFTTTTNASIWLCDNDYPNWGVWMYHMTNGQSDPNDTEGTQAIYAGSTSDLSLVSSGGVMVDTNLDIFVGQSRQNENAVYDAMEYTNWNGGILPPDNSEFNYSLGLMTNQVAWGFGSGVDQTSTTYPYFEAAEDMVINSRTNPTILACPLGIGSQTTKGGGIRLLNATNGSVITAGSQVLTNLDWQEAYTCAAWDNVGNLYAASTTRNLWRVYSPPGANTNTTVSLVSMAVQPMPATVSLTVSSFSGNAGTNATPITATFLGSAPVTLQWYYTDTNNNTFAVSGQVSNGPTTSTLLLSNLMDSEIGNQYFLVASNSLGAATSSVAVLSVINPTASLATMTFSGDANGNATPITATYNGIAPVSLQWYQVDLSNDTNMVTGQTNATLALTNLSASQNGYKYFMVASWPYAPSAATSEATLTVYNSPNITTNITPLYQIVPTGTTGTFTVGGTGALPLQFQWYEDGSSINGATNSTYTYTATNGTSTFYVTMYNSVNLSGVNSSTATVIAPMTALSFSSTTGTNSNQGWDLNGGATFSSPGVLQLTTAAGSEARSAFYAATKLPINGFLATFIYAPGAGTSTRADGTTFCLQESGPTALGSGGGDLGYTGIANPSVAFEMNLYTGATGGIGISFNTNGGIGPNGKTGPINVNSLDPIAVTIFYNPLITNVFIKLVDTVSNVVYTTNYTGAVANITNVLGTNVAWVGFTGGTGGDDAVQSVSNFLFQSTSNAAITHGQASGGNLPLSWNVGGMILQSTPALQGTNTVWTPVSSTITTNLATGQAQTTVPVSSPSEFYQLVTP